MTLDNLYELAKPQIPLVQLGKLSPPYRVLERIKWDCIYTISFNLSAPEFLQSKTRLKQYLPCKIMWRWNKLAHMWHEYNLLSWVSCHRVCVCLFPCSCWGCVCLVDKEHYPKAGPCVHVDIHGHDSCCMLLNVPGTLKFIHSRKVYWAPTICLARDTSVQKKQKQK